MPVTATTAKDHFQGFPKCLIFFEFQPLCLATHEINYSLHIKNIAAHLVRDAVSALPRSGTPIFQRFLAKTQIQIIPAVKCRPGDAQPVQCLLGRQMRSFDQPDNLQLF